MNICPFCEHNNREGILVCDRCGRSKSIFGNLPTRVIPDETNPSKPRWQGSDHFTNDMFVVMHIEDVREPLILHLDHTTVLGRVNTVAGQYPDVDLTDYDAFVKGVSSRHLALERGDYHLLLTDLNSTNGTFLNGKRLPANQPTPVRDGAEIRVGKLIVHLYFESSSCAPLRQNQHAARS
jgi:hypothetical protein